MDKFEQLQALFDGMKTDREKFFTKGQNAAGTRLRKELNNIRKLCADMRKEIQEIRASRKIS